VKREVRIAAALALLAGCATVPRAPVLPPLENEGELHVVMAPLPQDAARLSFRLAAVSASRADGTEVPLELLQPGVSRAAVPAERPVAWGRLPPGGYSGLSLVVERATLTGEGGPSDVLVPAEPIRVPVAFTLVPRRAEVVVLELRPSAANDRMAVFAPQLGASVSRAPLSEQSAFCTIPGRQEVIVLDKRTRALSAVLPTGREPWGVALDPVRRRIYVAESGADVVVALDPTAREEVGRARLQPGDGPRELALTPDGRLLVIADGGSNNISFVDTASMQEIARAPAGEAPTAILMDRTGSRAWIANERSTFLTVVDVEHRAVVGTIPSDFAPLRPALSRDGTRLYVVSPRGAYLSVVSTATGQLAGRAYVGLGTTAIKVDSATNFLWVAQGGSRRLSVFDPLSLLPFDFVQLPAEAEYLAIADPENVLFATLPARGSVVAIDLAARRLLGELEAGPAPRALAIGVERY
jgi:YVTN family beta-propeller protein